MIVNWCHRRCLIPVKISDTQVLRMEKVDVWKVIGSLWLQFRGRIQSEEWNCFALQFFSSHSGIILFADLFFFDFSDAPDSSLLKHFSSDKCLAEFGSKGLKTLINQGKGYIMNKDLCLNYLYYCVYNSDTNQDM